LKSTLFIDYDDTLHNSESKYISNLDGLLGLDGATLLDIFINKIHRDVHNRFPQKHDDLNFHIELLFKEIGWKSERNTITEFENALEKAEKECWENPSYFKDTYNFLKKVTNSGYIVCLTTGPNSKEKAQALERNMALKIFNYVFGEDNLGFIKSDPHYYKQALLLSQADPLRTATLGDTLSTDVIPAKKLGLKTILINRKGNTETNLQTNPDYKVSNLYEAFECFQVIFKTL
jgi:HAD superfamily hydrolase (TIGR01549 family)